MANSTLPLSILTDVTVLIQPNAVAPPAFNQYIIVGNSTNCQALISTTVRAVQFAGGTTILQQLITFGFALTDPEYQAASAYLSSTPGAYYLWIGVQGVSETPLEAVTACRNVAPQWYLFTALAAVDADNIALTEFAQTAAPVCQNFFSTSSSNVPAGSDGNIFSVLKAGNYNRYQGVYSTTQVAATTTIATTSTSPTITLTSATGVVIGQTVQAAGVPLGTTLINLVGTTGTLSANATATATGVTTEFLNAFNNTYIASALAGLAMGLNTGFNNSYYTLTNKVLVGMTPEPISTTQYLTITGNNGNIYCSFGGSFDSYATGITGSGQYFDNVLGIDMLVADLQYAGANALAQFNAIGGNDSGQAVLLHAINVNGCQPSRNRGFLSPGVWTGNTIQFGNAPNQTIMLQAGVSVPNGYLSGSPSYGQIPKPAKRASAPIYIGVIQTDAIQQVVIALLVQQ
jgi:hypothetical protein